MGLKIKLPNLKDVLRVGVGLAGGPAGIAAAATTMLTRRGAPSGGGLFPGLPSGGEPGGFGLPGDWGTPGRGLFGSAHGRVKPTNGQCPKGYHLNKHKLADKTNARSVCVRNRHMNALNGRSAMRAVRRLKRAAKLVRRIHAFTTRTKKGGSGHPSGCRCISCSRRK